MEVSCWACGADTEPLLDYPDGLRGCAACGLGFQPDRSAKALHALYNEEHFETRYIEPAARVDWRLPAEVRMRLVCTRVRAGRLLEVGTAGGHFLAVAREAGFDPLGVEPSAEMARAARALSGAEVVASPIEQAALPKSAFDVACLWHVVEHILAPLDSLARVRAALRPGAPVFLEVPNFGGVRARREKVAWPTLVPSHHVGHYTPAALDALLRRAGFVDVTTCTVPPSVYRRPPRSWASYGKQAVLLRGWPFGEHPWKHDLLRAVAHAPRR